MPQQKSTEESTRVRIPSLKFTIKSGCKALSEGKRLWNFGSTRKFGVKFVRIDPKTRPGEMHMGSFTPGADYKFKEGDVCWILPHLPSPVKRCGEKDTDFTQKLVREFGNSQIFTVGKSNAICVKPKTPGTDLKGFMAEFDLQDEDLELAKLPVVAFKYTRYCPASPCTVPCAEKLLLELLKFEEDPDKLANLGELLALNLRRNFSISPVAVVKCHSKELCEGHKGAHTGTKKQQENNQKGPEEKQGVDSLSNYFEKYFKPPMDKLKNDLLEESMRKRVNLIVPDTASNFEATSQMIQRLRAAGYHMRFAAVYGEEAEVLCRGRARASEEGKEFTGKNWRKSVEAILKLQEYLDSTGLVKDCGSVEVIDNSGSISRPMSLVELRSRLETAEH
ncbi:unnamed protein product [Cladocopium goreaui]|uniref:Zeta toxin domain-containing protein n=1 Tax=Cladocopium goreaui TaxID=2562237 RepID=A0A9P1BKQ5_9DINO|nr:unnamed protein product [Cladocopium goreaui]